MIQPAAHPRVDPPTFNPPAGLPLTRRACWRIGCANVTKLVGRSGYRLRVGDWRVIYELEDEQLVLLVIRIAPGGEVYE